MQPNTGIIMLMVTRRHTKKNKTKLFATLAVFVLLSAGVIVWLVNRNPSVATIQQTSHSIPEPGGINLDPPTEEDKAEVEKNKDKLADQTNATPAPKGSATVVITRAEQYSDIEVAAYVSNLFEDGGTCTLTLNNGGHTITRQSTGIQDARKTTCPAFSIPRSEFPVTGAWKITVSYNSAAANGSVEGSVTIQ